METGQEQLRAALVFAWDLFGDGKPVFVVAMVLAYDATFGKSTFT